MLRRDGKTKELFKEKDNSPVKKLMVKVDEKCGVDDE